MAKKPRLRPDKQVIASLFPKPVLKALKATLERVDNPPPRSPKPPRFGARPMSKE